MSLKIPVKSIAVSAFLLALAMPLSVMGASAQTIDQVDSCVSAVAHPSLGVLSLLVYSLCTSIPRYSPGRVVDITISLTNIGTVLVELPAIFVTLRLLSPPSGPGVPGTIILFDGPLDSALDPGETVSVLVFWRASAPPGEYTLWLRAITCPPIGFLCPVTDLFLTFKVAGPPGS